METIKNYLEAMFANMPNTPEVNKAKSELLTMMEDKYNELIAEGESENTAVGTVITEFGNLDELAEDLGLAKEVEETHERQKEEPRRFVSGKEIENFLSYCRKRAFMVGLGVFLCITSVIWPIFTDEFDTKINEAYGVAGMFISIAVAVGLFVYSGMLGAEFEYLKKEACQIDISTAHMVRDKRAGFKGTHAIMVTIGVVLCAFCWLPVAITDMDEMAVILFLLVGIGVYLFIFSSGIMGGFDFVLKINDANTISGKYGKEDQVEYNSKATAMIMEVYWPTVVCLYLIVSFVSFEWSYTWIIWPIAAIVYKILKIAFTKED